MVESATEYAIFAIDPSGAVISWNAGAARVLGYESSEIMGRSADVIFTPEDRARGVPDQERFDASTKGRALDERWTMRKSGERFWASGLMMPLADLSQGYVKILRDRTEAHLTEARQRADEERFRVLATNIPQLVFRCRPGGARTWGSPQWIAFTGLDLPQSLEFGWMDAVHPDDHEATHLAWTDAAARRKYEVEHRIRHAQGGEYRWHQTRARPLEMPGDPAELDWIGTSTDIHENRTLRDRQKLLLAELQHRTRNLLGLAQAIAGRLMRRATSLEQFWTEFQARLGALGRVQALMGAAESGISLQQLIENELHAHASEREDRIAVSGPHLILPDSAAQALALGIHELVTNAVKYGALGQAGGRLEVQWEIDPRDESTVVTWQESGVRMGPAAERLQGFGSELLTRALPYQLGAKTSLTFGEDGVRCVIVLPPPRPS
jgi:PAS domain S-box-containing protein